MKTQLRFKPRNGFALVVTVSMMVLLTIVVVATLSLSTVTLRSVDRGSAQAVARANARLAMMMAIGQLQKYAGPDQRVTATADIESDNMSNPKWTGVWNTESTKQSADPEAWLVSGDDPRPQSALNDRNSALLASAPQSDPGRKELRAPFVQVPGEKLDGRFAYWVGDEGVKARVDISSPTEKIADNEVARKTARANSPQEPGLAMFDSEYKQLWDKFQATSNDPFDRSSLVSLGTVAIATNTASGGLKPQEVPKHYFNDLTTGGLGLPVNVRDGGMKADLSVLFDRSMETNAPMLRRYMGTVPAKDTAKSTYQTTNSISDPKKYFLSDSLSKNGTSRVGPNWGNLFSYARLWENVSNNQTRMIGALPRPSSDLRMDNWAPYSNDTGGEFAMDPQHGNSSITPVISLLQFTVRVRARGPFRGTPDDPPAGQYYIPQLEIKPVVGLWNPYNVTISSSSYLINWALAPYMRLAHAASGGYQDIHEVWLREYWKTGNPAGGGVSLPTEGSQGGGYFNLQTGAITLAPGEFRLFSINKSEPLAGADAANRLVETWGEDGGFYMDIKRSSDARAQDDPNGKMKKGTPLKVPTGNDIWFGAICLQDTQMNTQEVIDWGPGVGTQAHFNNQIGASATSSWVTLKATGDLHLNRYTNFWNGGTNQQMGTPVGNPKRYFVPEHVRHSKHSNNQTRRSYKIQTLGSGNVGHLATWRMMIRNATEGQSSVATRTANQGLRGWIDTNPRAMAGSPRFDGSRVYGNEVEGWNFLSSYTGDRNDYPNVMGEALGKGGSRGLVAEGQLGDIEPPGELVAGRYVGYGGAASTIAEGGVSNVILFDVPRGPLTSVGQLQHAQLSRYNYEPSFIVGNSYADVRMPPNQIMVENFAKGFYASTAPGFRLVDTSYEVNNRLWDTVFFSTLAPDYGGAGSYAAFDMKAYSDGTRELPNPRMLLTPLPGDKSVDDIIKGSTDRAPEALASRIGIKGAFNVHSTSKQAWKAVLSSMGGSDIPVVPLSPTATSTDWTDKPGVHFNRFTYPGSKTPYEAAKPNSTDEFWRGWRKLSDEELDKLADEIVKEVKERGPFRSMAEFVNRNPKGTLEQQQKGPLQAALDRTLNNLPDDTGKVAMKPDGASFPGTPGITRQSAGYPGNILQGDVLQSLAPILQVRSDYFRIRTCGEALDKNGNVLARAWCEAFVQRTGDYINSADKPEVSYLELGNDVNKAFGRRFQLVSFRWLDPSEI